MIMNMLTNMLTIQPVRRQRSTDTTLMITRTITRTDIPTTTTVGRR